MRINLMAPVSLEAILAAITAFRRWWFSELAALCPERWRRHLNLASVRPCLQQTGQAWRLVWPGAAIEDLTISDDQSPEDVRQAMAQLIGNVAQPNVTVELPERDYLSRRITLPAAASTRLRAIVALQIDKISPFDAGDVEFEAKIIEQTTDSATAEIFIIPKSVIERYREWLSSLGLYLGELSSSGCASRINTGERIFSFQNQKRNLALMALGVLLMTLAISLAPILRQDELSNMAAQVHALKLRSRLAEKAREKLDHVAAVTKFLSNRSAVPEPLEIVKTLTTLLPDSYYLRNLVIEGDTIHLRAVGPNANALVRLLARSGHFRDVKIVDARPTKDAAGQPIIIVMHTKSASAAEVANGS